MSTDPDAVAYPAGKPIAQMAASDIYRGYVRYVGVGAIATAGIFGIIKSLRVIGGSFGIALKAFRHGEAHDTERTDRDIHLAPIVVIWPASSYRRRRFLSPTRR